MKYTYLFLLLIVVSSLSAMKGKWSFCSPSCKGGVHQVKKPCPKGVIPIGYSLTEEDWKVINKRNTENDIIFEEKFMSKKEKTKGSGPHYLRKQKK